MNLEIDGKNALITGASSGIGEACAHELASNGVNVALVARREELLSKVCTTVEIEYGVKAHPIVSDLRVSEAPNRVVGEAVKALGGIDILVNNAGRAHSGGLMAASEEDWEDMLAIKFSAMRRMCRECAPHMKKNRWGRIVNMSSIGGIYSNPKLLISHTLSAAINNFTKGFALEVARDRILVNAIGIGAVTTDNWANNMIPKVKNQNPNFSNLTDEQIIKQLGEEMTPVGHFGHPEDIASIAAYLASARNRFVTGCTIEASGGADRFV